MLGHFLSVKYGAIFLQKISVMFPVAYSKDEDGEEWAYSSSPGQHPGTPLVAEIQSNSAPGPGFWGFAFSSGI